MSEVLVKLSPALIGFMGTIIGALVVTIGWFISHKLTLQREIEAKRREQHLTYLVQTYRTLSKVKPYGNSNKLSDLVPELQGAIADIQFLGSIEQVTHAQKFAQAWSGGPYDLDPLLKSLRDELRIALGKRVIESDIWWIAMTPGSGPIREYWRSEFSSGI